jgi:hypothetical protein
MPNGGRPGQQHSLAHTCGLMGRDDPFSFSLDCSFGVLSKSQCARFLLTYNCIACKLLLSIDYDFLQMYNYKIDKYILWIFFGQA